MPNIAEVAIMRNENGRVSRDYTYRPYYVRLALMWLKANNHLYSQIILDWPNDHDWENPTIVLDPPYLPLSNNDILAIDESDVADCTNDTLESSKSGTKTITIQLIMRL